MPKIDEPVDKEQVPTSPEPVRLTRAAARRLGSVDRDTPTTPKRSNSAMSLDVISEDSSSSMRATRASKRASPLSPIHEKENSKTGTPVRRTRRASVAVESPVPQSFRTLRRPNKDFSDTEGSSSTATTTSNPLQPRMTRQRATSELTQQNVENLNGKGVTFCESPEREKELIQFPKTPITEKRKSAEGEQPDTSFESICSDKVAVVCLERLTSFNISDGPQDKTVIEVQRAQESEKNSDEAVEDVAVREVAEVAEAEKTAEEGDKGGKEEEEVEKKSEETAGAEMPEFSKSWSQAVSGQQSNETPIDAFGEKERKEQEEKLKEHAETVAKKDILYSLVKVFSDDDDDEEKEDEAEEKKDKPEFIDDEAIEVSDDNESMDPEEREYLSQQEIPEQGIDIGSEDTNTDQEDDDEVLSEDRDFITFSDAENVDGKEDSLDELAEECEKVDKQGKKIRRRIIVQDTSSDDEEVEAPAETFGNTQLVKFSGTMLREMLEETQLDGDRAVIEADFDEDVAMDSLASPEKQKKTPQKTPERKSLTHNLEADFQQSLEKDPMPKEVEVVAETPEKPEEMDQDEPPENEAEPHIVDNSQSWEDIEEEEDNSGSKLNSNISAVMARCNEYLQMQRKAKVAQKQMNMKKKAAKERKRQLKKEEEEKRAERERLKQELKEQKRREKETEENQLKNEEIVRETTNEEQKKIPVISTKSQKSKRDKKKLPAEDVFQFQGVQPSEKKGKKTKPEKILSQEVKESVQEPIAKKKKKKREMEEPLEGIQEKPTKKKKLPVDEPCETSSSSSKRLPESLLNKLEASDGASKKVEGKKKRCAEEDLEKPQKKHKSTKETITESPPELINTPVGMFSVQPMKNPFSIPDAKLIKKSLVTKQFKREKKLKRKNSIQEPSAVFPRPMTSWSASGTFTITNLQPQTRVVEAGGAESMEFVVTTLEPKRKLSKKSSATSVFDSETKKPVKGFKEDKLYGNGAVRESSSDLMYRRIKKKFAHK